MGGRGLQSKVDMDMGATYWGNNHHGAVRGLPGGATHNYLACSVEYTYKRHMYE